MESAPSQPAEVLKDGWPLIVIGICLLAGFVAHVVGQRAHVPRVTLLLLLGALVGPSGFDLASPSLVAWFPLATQLALSMIGFELGERFLGRRIRTTGSVIVVVSIVVTIGTAMTVFVGLLAAGGSVVLCLLLAGIAPATAPAATVDVVREARAKGPLTNVVLAVVAIDDAISVMLFSVLVVAAKVVSEHSVDPGVVGMALWQIGGAVLIGLAFGVPMALLTGRIRSGELTLLETLGFVLCASGVASLLGVSYLIAAMTQGAVVANLARHHTRPFHAIENITQPFLVVFFVLAGIKLELDVLKTAGLIALVYVGARSFGRVAFGSLGASIARADVNVRRYVGWCLLPQAGVALGLGLLAANEFPAIGDRILTLLISTTIVFEIMGPVVTRLALRMAGESESRTVATRRSA